MREGWRDCTLGDVIELKRGYDLPNSDRRAGTIPIISSSGQSGWHDDAKVRGPGVVTGRYGTIGEVFFVTEDFWPLNTTLYVRDFKGNDERFIAYFLRSLNFQAYNDKSSVPGLNRNDLHRYEVSVPPPGEQRAIAAVLGALDDKIEHNRRTARALERLARAIFRAWFVDFEPVKAKAAGATSFPSMPQPVFDAFPTRLVDSEIGPVPEGWEVKPLSQTVVLTMGQSPPSEFYNKEGNGLPFHQGVTDYGFRFPTHRVYCTAEGRLAEPGDVLLSVRAPVGRINVADRRLVLGRGLAGLRHRNDCQSFLLQQLRHLFAEEDAVGDGTIYKAVTKEFIANMSLLVPAEVIQQAFEDLVGPVDGLVAASEMENRKLAEMRDYLLPKLLSGKVRVKETEQLLEATT